LFDIFLTDEAREQLDRVKIDRGLSKRYKAVKKAIEFLSRNPRHHGLQTHEFTTLKGPKRKSNQPLSQSLLIHKQIQLRIALLTPVPSSGATPVKWSYGI